MVSAGISPNPIAFDLDSVLAECRYIPKMVGQKFGYSAKEIAEFSTCDDGYQKFQYELPGVSGNQMYKAINDVVHDYSLTALTTPYMREVLWYLWHVSGLPVTICTARKRSNADVTYCWLTDNLDGIPFNCFISCGREKWKILPDAGTRFFVDDRYKTIDSLWGRVQFPILYRRPWNQGWAEEASPYQCRDLRDMIPFINMAYNLPPVTWPGYIPYPETV